MNFAPMGIHARISINGEGRNLMSSTTKRIFMIRLGALLSGIFTLCLYLFGAGAASGTKLKQVIIVYKSHFDLGYTDLPSNVVSLYRTRMIENTLQVIDQYRGLPKDQQFVWTIPGWPMEQMLWEGQDPDRKEKIIRALRAGNLAVHALPGTTHTESLGLEDLVRELDPSTNIAASYGLSLPRAGKMTDVPCHTWIIPTLLKNAGIDFLHIGCNDSSMAVQVPILFWWEGPDGSKLLTMYTHHYGTQLDPPEDWPHSTWLALLHTGDNQGPPPPDTVKNDLAFYTKKYPGVNVKVGRLEDFTQALLKENPDLPVIRADMPDTWIHGPLSMPEAVQTIRNARPRLFDLESLNTLESLWGLPPAELKKVITAAYEQSFLFSEHTWGLANQSHVRMNYEKKPGNDYWSAFPINSPDKDGIAQMEASWQEHANYAQKTWDLTQKPLDDRLNLLASSISLKGKRMVVYNPLPWPRNGVVPLPEQWGNYSSVKDAVNGQTFPIGKGRDKRLSFIPSTIPGMGYRSFVPGEAVFSGSSKLSVDRGQKTIESPYFKAILDPEGGRIASLIDKKTGRELVDPAAPQGFGQYLYERFGKAEIQKYVDDYVVPGEWHNPDFLYLYTRTDVPESPHLNFTPANMQLEFEETPLSAAAIMKCALSPAMPHGVSFRLILYRDIPVVDLEFSVEAHADGWPDAAWICLPFKIDNPQYRAGRVGSIVNPLTDFIEGSSFRYFWTDTGMAVFNDQAGVGFCPVDSPLVSLGEPGIMKYDRHYEPKQPWVYINLYNTKWNTNFRTWFDSKLTSSVRLWCFEKYDPATALIIPAVEARNSLLAATAEGGNGKLPKSQRGITLSRPGVLLTAFALDRSKEGGTLLRVWDQAGKSGLLKVNLPTGCKFVQAQPVNLRNEKTGTHIPVKKGSFQFNLGAFAPASFLLE
jgi:alpha-mannosidase